MKGQFFIIGAIIICTLFFIALPFSGPAVNQSSMEDIEHISGNLNTEFVRAFNLGLAEDRPVSALREFTAFTRSVMTDKFASFHSFWVISEPTGTGINITVGNFMGGPVDVILDISGDTRNLNIPDSDNASEIYDPLPQDFTLNVTFAQNRAVLGWARDKNNIYVYYRTVRDGESVVREVEG